MTQEYFDLHGAQHVPTAEDEISFRPGVYVFTTNSKGEVLLILDVRSQGFWELPGGGLEIGESYSHAAIREVKEETGYNLVLNSEQAEFLDYDLTKYLNGNFHHEINIFYSGTVDESQQGEQNFAEDEKILEYKFVSLEELAKTNMIPFQKNAVTYFLEKSGK